MGKLALSYSSGSLFEQCPFRFHAEKVRKIKQPPSIPMALGNFLHEVANKYVQHLMAIKKNSDFDEADVIALRLWGSRQSHKDWRILPELVKDEMLGMVRALREHLVIDPSIVVGTELQLAFDDKWKRCEWFGPSAWFRMIIDRLDITNKNVGIIEDYKTGRKIDGAEKSMQLWLYAMGVRLLVPTVKKFKVQLYYARMDALKESEIKKAQMDKAKEWAEALSDRVEHCRGTDEWPATPGDGCKFCPVSQECPSKKQTSNMAAPLRMDDAEKLLERLIVVRDEKDELTEKIKAFVKQNGAVEVNGIVADFKIKRSWTYDMAAFRKIISGAGLEPLDYTSVSATKIKTLLKTRGALREPLLGIATEKPSSVFGLQNVKK